jgi:hypothetical protein
MISIARAATGLLFAVGLFLQQESDAAEQGPALKDRDVAEVVKALNRQLQEKYPLVELGGQYQRAITAAWQGGTYRGLAPCELAKRLSSDLRAVHRDRHLNVRCGTLEPGPDLPPDKLGHGIESVQLDSQASIAVIKSPGPWSLEDEAFDTASHAMALAADAKNVVIDVRDNPGGHGEIAYFFATYFLPKGEVRLFERGLFRPPQEPELIYTLADVPGRRMADARLFILVNSRTASAAEGFAFGMQQMHRATIVGQTTAGAGIAGTTVSLGHGVLMFIPFKLVVAPDSDTAYEGVGVVPDLKTAPGEEYAAVQEAVRKDKDAAIRRDVPVIVAAQPAGAEREFPPLADPTPNLESCDKRSFDEARHLDTVSNACGRAVTAQYMSSEHADMVMELRQGPGERLEVHPAKEWSIFALCPEGYYSTLRVTPENRKAIAAGAYSCTRHQD